MKASSVLFLVLATVGLRATGLAQTNIAEEALRRGEVAMGRGDHAGAYQHFMVSLTKKPGVAATLELLMENALRAGDEDAATRWLLDWHAIAADKRGRAKLPRKLAALFPAQDSHPAEISKARAAAVRELLRFRTSKERNRGPAAGLVVEWAEDLARSLAAPSPNLSQEHTQNCDPALTVDKALWKATTGKLEALCNSALNTGDLDTALRAARCLLGMARQAGFGKDCLGPTPPSMSSESSTASSTIGRVRKLTAAQAPSKLDELRDMSLEEAREFTRSHGSFGAPGKTWSPENLYLVETSCGRDTLLGAAETVEFHHQRLVNWFEQDPFVGRPGTLRLVPDSHGLEAEGAPFYWVGGFQGGDITTLSFMMSTIPALGRGITHELTHRFDGAIYSGLPAWMIEGRAVWTGSAYGYIEDEEFIPNHVNPGTFSATRNMGYHRPEKLKEMLVGPEEYRDNYTVGYSLWVFLSTWTGGDPEAELRYGSRLFSYMNEPNKRRGDPLAAFLSFFADNKEGRPDGIRGFAEDFDAFLRGWSAKEPPKWVSMYTSNTGGSDSGEVLLDEPTWTWLRGRSEPWFGQEQASIATELFSDRKKWAEAANALRWALAVDEPSDSLLEMGDQILASLPDPHAAWAFRRWPRFGGARRQPWPDDPCPFGSRLRATSKLADALADAAADYQERGLPFASAAMAADHDTIAVLLGRNTLGGDAEVTPGLGEQLLSEKTGLHPFHPSEFPLGRNEWVEDDLVQFDRERGRGYWILEPKEDILHVGRKTLPESSGTMDRSSPSHPTLVRSKTWLAPGRYRVRAQFAPSTIRFSGGIALGWNRRDRTVRISISCEDDGLNDKPVQLQGAIRRVRWSMDGNWPRSPRPSGTVVLDHLSQGFKVEALVDGPTVELFIGGQLAGWFSTVDGRPISGHAGFYANQGSMAVRDALVQRQDRLRQTPAREAVGRGLHPRLPGVGEWSLLENRPATGLALGNSGTVLLWFADTDRKKHPRREILETLVADWEREGPSQKLILALPAAWKDEIPLLEIFQEHFPGGLNFILHKAVADLAEDRWPAGMSAPVLSYIDPAGIIRWTGRWKRFRRGLPDGLRKLLDQTHGHSRPGAAGAGD